MSKTDVVSFTCPKCVWTVKTPFGEKDAAEHISLRVDGHHNDKVTRARITKSELIKPQRK